VRGYRAHNCQVWDRIAADAKGDEGYCIDGAT
jgi:hypothetical protein